MKNLTSESSLVFFSFSGSFSLFWNPEPRMRKHVMYSCCAFVVNVGNLLMTNYTIVTGNVAISIQTILVIDTVAIPTLPYLNI